MNFKINLFDLVFMMVCSCGSSFGGKLGIVTQEKCSLALKSEEGPITIAYYSRNIFNEKQIWSWQTIEEAVGEWENYTSVHDPSTNILEIYKGETLMKKQTNVSEYTTKINGPTVWIDSGDFKGGSNEASRCNIICSPDCYTKENLLEVQSEPSSGLLVGFSSRMLLMAVSISFYIRKKTKRT